MLSYRTIRQITFTVYVLLTVGFCGILIYFGKQEIEKARIYSENEKVYLDTLLSCRRRVNITDQAFIKYIEQKDPGLLTEYLAQCLELRAAVTKLRNLEETRPSLLQITSTNLHDLTERLYSAALAIASDRNRPFPDSLLLVSEDIAASDLFLREIREEFQSLLRTEFNHVEIWQKQSVFFYNRLQYLVVTFFILSTLFSVGASVLFSYILNLFLRKLRVGTQEISSGNFNYRFEESQHDELGLIMNDFNDMAEKLDTQTEDLIKANRELQAKTEALIEAHQHKDRFMANMSHELRTPLNSIIGFADLLVARSDRFDSKKIGDYGNRILNAGEHLLDLISDLLDVAKIDAGFLQPVIAKYNLSALLDEAVSMLTPLAEAKALKIETRYAANLPLECDKRLLLQVFINIINNGIKFTHKGTITISVREESTKGYCIDIRDTGIGINKDELKQIFKDFHRVESGLTSNYDGVGLGLTLSKRLIELHAGRIIVHSIVDKGTTFSIKLPKKQKKRKKK